MKGSQVIKAGRIEVGSTLSITDPCYERNTWCRINNAESEPGRYNCYVVLIDDGTWGERVSSIAVIRDTMPEWDGTLNNFPEQIGEIGVDSGTAGFLPDRPDGREPDFKKLCEEMNGRKWLLTDDVFISDSGLGDGCYPVYRYDGEPGVAPGFLIRFM